LFDDETWGLPIMLLPIVTGLGLAGAFCGVRLSRVRPGLAA
jgi:hypothetical protein